MNDYEIGYDYCLAGWPFDPEETDEWQAGWEDAAGDAEEAFFNQK